MTGNFAFNPIIRNNGSVAGCIAVAEGFGIGVGLTGWVVGVGAGFVAVALGAGLVDVAGGRRVATAPATTLRRSGSAVGVGEDAELKT